MIAPEPNSERLIRVPIPSVGDKVLRLAWALIQATLFRCSPVPMHGFRCKLLRLFGARIASPAYVYPTATIWAPWNLEMARGSCLGPRVICYSVGQVKLSTNALVSQCAHLCAATHDHHDPTFPLLIGSIEIGDGAWIAADAFVGPGVCIGAQAVVGARTVVVRDIKVGEIVVGNPARAIGTRKIAAT